MAEVVELIKELSEKFDTLQEDVDSLKECSGKQKRRVSIHTAGITPDPIRDLRADPSPWGGPHTSHEKENLGEIHLLVVETFSKSLERNTWPTWQSEIISKECRNKFPVWRNSPEWLYSCANEQGKNLPAPRVWHEIPIDDTLDYNEVITWGDSDEEAGDHLIPPIWQQSLKRWNL